MKYIESFFWGIMVAVAGLFVETFFQIVFSDFLHFTFFSVHYPELKNLASVLISIFFIALIEESLKLSIFYKRILLFTENYQDLFFNGFLLGFGFFSFEFFLAFYNENISLIFWQFFLVFLTHTILGVLTLLSLVKFFKNRIIKTLTLIVFLHSLVNFLIFYFL